MRTKKTLVLLLVLILTVSLISGCANQQKGDAPSAGSASSEDTPGGAKRIFMSSAYYTAPYGAPLQEAVQDKAKELGYEITIVDGEANADKQLSQFKTAVADGYDALIYWPGDQASTPPIVEYLNSTGLPWVALNTVVDDSVIDKVPCMIASDEVEIGRNVGRLMIEYFEKNPSDTKNVAYIEGSPGSSYTENLTKGMNEVIKGSGINILNEPQYAEYDPSKAMTIMEDLLTKFGDQIDLVVAQDGGMFQGAFSAIEAAEYVGKFGIICQGQDLIVKEKLLSGDLYASVAQDPYTEGSLSVEMLDKMIKGEEVEHWVVNPTGPIYADDVDNYSWF
ncbi:MAG TPA: sugar ABC transporter substrate-binding protein [Clostridiales bacterium]|nr:sugar ABC transporter substrate-binding protein [Clostridiales bacterium]